MYYLQDQHPEFEYTMLVQEGTGCPYLATTYNSFDKVLVAIERIEKTHCYKWNREFYIDNDFYKNEQQRSITGTYYKFLRRKVNDWEEFTKDSIQNQSAETYLRLVT